jgi:hypothetical protein
MAAADDALVNDLDLAILQTLAAAVLSGSKLAQQVGRSSDEVERALDNLKAQGHVQALGPRLGTNSKPLYILTTSGRILLPVEQADAEPQRPTIPPRFGGRRGV